MERTLVLIKPDGIQRELAGTIIERFERRSLKIVGMKMIHMDEKMAKKHYGVHGFLLLPAPTSAQHPNACPCAHPTWLS